MRLILTLLAGLASLAILAPVCFLLAVLLAGPHSSMLPSVLQPPVWFLGWATWLVVPVFVARAVWRRLAR